jgi:hypothetical protein
MTRTANESADDIAMPWNPKRLSVFQRIGLRLACILLPLAFFAGVFADTTIALMYHTSGTYWISWQALSYSAAWLAIAAVTWLAIRTHVYFRRLMILDAVEDLFANRPLAAVSASFSHARFAGFLLFGYTNVLGKYTTIPLARFSWTGSRSFGNFGTPTFSDGKMHLPGKLGPRPLQILLVIIMFIIVAAAYVTLRLYQATGFSSFFSGALGLGFLFALYAALNYDRSAAKEHLLSFAQSEVRSLRCQGPTVSIRFNHGVVQGVTGIEFYVGRSFRKRFFTNFDESFPGLLPAEYRAAIRRAQKPSQRADEGAT